jgi:excisionase family DNA binding protein
MTSRPHSSSAAPSDGALYTIRDIARKGKISEKTARRLINRGELQTHRIGTQIRVSEADWQAFLEDAREAK